jgi:hypothetical protein
VVVHRFRFLAHLAVASAVALAALAYGMASAWGAFLFPGNAFGRVASALVVLLLVATLVAAHLGLASTMTRRRRWVVGLVTSGILLVIGGVFRLAEEKSFSDVAEFPATLKPFPTTLLPTDRVEQLRAVEADLKRQVDALVATHE